MTLDIDALRGWIGRADRAADVVTPRLVQGLMATLDRDGPVPATGEPVGVPALHWCLAPPAVPMAGIGPDGHPARGGFLPPVALPRRMWAGGALAFHDGLRVGDQVERESRIADVRLKAGRTGALCFVTVEHRVTTPRGLAIEERQDIVYRGLDDGAPPSVPAQEGGAARWHREVVADPVLLFRYSALTFNGHRIHYDRAYCHEAEGYPGLVVHGPLQATLLLDLAAATRDGVPPGAFEFRGVRPLFDGAAFGLNAVETQDGLALWAADAAGHRTMTATARW